MLKIVDNVPRVHSSRPTNHQIELIVDLLINALPANNRLRRTMPNCIEMLVRLVESSSDIVIVAKRLLNLDFENRFHILNSDDLVLLEPSKRNEMLKDN